MKLFCNLLETWISMLSEFEIANILIIDEI